MGLLIDITLKIILFNNLVDEFLGELYFIIIGIVPNPLIYIAHLSQFMWVAH